MKVSLNSVHSIHSLFQEELEPIYKKEEISGFLHHLFFEYKGWSRAMSLLNKGVILSESEILMFYQALNELKQNKPIQYIIGKVPFYNLDFLVAPGVLIPRPETEELVSLILQESALRKYEGVSVLDIGAGSGCIGISYKKNLPASSVTLLDRSETALNISKQNAALNDVSVQLILADILVRENWKMIPAFNIIISNPPYVTNSEKREMRNNVLDYEPHEALFVPDEEPLLFYKAIAEFSRHHLIRPGLLYFEINERFGNEVKNLLLKKGFEKGEVLRDMNGKDRFIRAEVC
jgi:release factor glutamine methyltransferase